MDSKSPRILEVRLGCRPPEPFIRFCKGHSWFTADQIFKTERFNMPGPAIHHLIADKLLELAASGKLDPPGSTDFRDLVSNRDNLHWLYLGSQGPDFLFFHLSDWSPALRRPAVLVREVIEFIDDVKKTINKIVPDEILKIAQKVEKTLDDTLDRSSTARIIKEMTAETKQLIDALGRLVLDTGQKLILDEINPFDIFEHPYRDGINNDPKNWWYFDVLHYRYTGKFAKNLLQSSSMLSGPQKLYALGYLSHFAADTVGHPYVNILSGSPYRNASQRHKVAENYHDLLAYRDANLGRRMDLNHSRLHESYSRPPDQLEAIPTRKIDKAISEFIARNINDVYSVDEDKDGRLDFGPKKEIEARAIANAIELWYKWWASTTETGTLPPPEPYYLTKELIGIYEAARKNLTDVVDEMESRLENVRGGGLWDIIKALFALAIGAILMAGAILDAIAAAALTISAAAYRAALAVVYEHLFDAWQNLRLSIALKGLAYPLLQHQDHRHFLQFAHPMNRDSSGMSAYRHKDYLPLLAWPPRIQRDDGAYRQKRPAEHHLLYAPLHLSTDTAGHPVSHGELPSGTVVAPESYFHNDHQHYISGAIGVASKTLDKIGDIQTELASEPLGVSELQKAIENVESSLGNAVELTLELLERYRSGKEIPDFNLDADRGYGFLCWVEPEDMGKPNTPGPLATTPENDSKLALDKARTDFIDARWVRGDGGNV